MDAQPTPADDISLEETSNNIDCQRLRDIAPTPSNAEVGTDGFPKGPSVTLVSFPNGQMVDLQSEATKLTAELSTTEDQKNIIRSTPPDETVTQSPEKILHFEIERDGNAAHRSPPMTPVQGSRIDLAGLNSVVENKPNSYFAQRMLNFKNRKPPSFSALSMKADIQMDEHVVPLDELYARLEVNPVKGLSEEEVRLRIIRDGKNTIPPPRHVPEVTKFLRELLGGFSPLLLAGSLLCFVAFFIQLGSMSPVEVPFDNLYLAVVLLLVVIVTAVFLYAQKAKSERIMDSFKKMVPEHASVIRNGEEKRVLADDLVLGDVVEIRAGDRVPADIRLFEAKGLKVDNSSLTGESEAQPRKPVPSDNPFDSMNLCFYTTNAVEGWGRGVVIRRGDKTVLGSIATVTAQLQHVETTIAKEINAFVRLISILAVVTGIIFIIVPLSLGRDFLITIILAISLIVGNVPGGIVIAVTVVLTLTAQRMAKNNCLMKNLEAVESLGACSVICTDKTGTLTQNRMTVSHCWVDNNLTEINTSFENLAGKDLPSTQTMKDLIRVASLCNRARFKIESPGGPVYSREVVGDASETALLKFVEAIGGRSQEMRRTHPTAVEIPFNSLSKFQVSIHEVVAEKSPKNEDGYLLVMKGAPEKIWSLCSTLMVDGQERLIDDEWTKRFIQTYEQLGGMGERCLGCCQLWLPTRDFPVPTQFDAENPNFPLDGLTFLGMFSLIDPIRCTVPDAVIKCRAAGIRIIMVTGDHPVTAKAVARKCGILSHLSETVEEVAERLGTPVCEVNPKDAKAVIITGDQLRTMDDLQLDMILRTHPEIIFARTSPIQKLVIVEACQRLGVVAVTGDGANDAPALKKAQIGVAMGITGSDVSKQAADMILLDDNFSSIVTGIEEGRLVFDNLKKAVCYNIVSNVPGVMPVVLYFLLDIPLGMTSIPMLLLNVVTDMIPSISMAHESAEEDIMKFPPRNINDRLVNARLIHCAYMQAGIICTAGAYFTYCVCFAQNGFRPSILFGLRATWENQQINDLEDSYGQEWNYSQRMEMQRVINTVFFVSVVVFQWGDAVMRKVRRESIFNKGMRNWLLNFSLVAETLITIFVTYTPGLNTALTLHSIKFIWWLPALPFGLLFCIWDEIRRLWIRRNPGGWLEREFYF